MTAAQMGGRTDAGAAERGGPIRRAKGRRKHAALRVVQGIIQLHRAQRRVAALRGHAQLPSL